MIDPDGTSSRCTTGTIDAVVQLDHEVIFPESGESWRPISELFFCTSQPTFLFTNAEILNYFVVRKTVDDMPACDTKSINKSSLNLYRCGHVQQITGCFSADQKHVCIKAKCIPEMRKDRIYHLTMTLILQPSCDIISCACGCPAGKGPHGSCKHIGALCYALEEFSRIGKTPEYATCTDKLQEWNKPRPKKLAMVPVTSLTSRRNELLLKKKKTSPVVSFDPRPVNQRKLGDEAIERFRCDLLSLSEAPAFLDLLIPSVKKIKHDHTYSKAASTLVQQSIQLPVHENDLSLKERESNLPTFALDPNTELKCAAIKASLNVSSIERERIEAETRMQAKQEEWFAVRAKRITGSKCGRILCQIKKTTSLLRECLYPTPLNPPPKPIAWGRRFEQVAIEKYTAHMNAAGKKVIVSACGFLVHPTEGWLGASPDGVVVDATCEEPNGLLEVKCPYTQRDKKPVNACSDSNFYCELVDSEVRLKKRHAYYHQVQLQLYVAGDLYKWCDFVVYTSKGVSVQRIFPDNQWQKDSISQLESFFNNCMLPEIVLGKYKPRYYL